MKKAATAKPTQPVSVKVKLAKDAIVDRIRYKVGDTVEVSVAQKEIMMSRGIIGEQGESQ